MNLCHNKELFEQAVLQTAETLEMNPAIVEKDYYVTKLLKYLVEAEPNIIFKGGTSLSKCYRLIHRFSEDIDLNYDSHGGKLTEGMRKQFSKLIKETSGFHGFVLENPEEVRSRREFNRYRFRYQSDYALSALKPQLIVETAIAAKSFPTELKKADSLIYQYLKAEGQQNVIAEYGLMPFDVVVQTKERTFVDKIFAVCDYYLVGKVEEHSRHLYDLYKLFPVIDLDETFAELVGDVRNVRKTSRLCPSAQDGCSLRDTLSELIEREAYRSDYQNITRDLLFEDVTYEAVIMNLKMIAELDLWDSKH